MTDEFDDIQIKGLASIGSLVKKIQLAQKLSLLGK